MGRYISNGIVTEIEVYSKKDEKKELKDLKEIKKHLSKYFCLDYYDLEDNQENDSFYFKMNKDMFEQNIHDCIKDFCKLRTPHIDEVMGCEKIDYNSKNFNQDNFPLRLEWKENYKGKSLEIVGREKTLNQGYPFGDPYWLYWDCDLFGREGKYRIYLTIKPIWYDYSKILIEDETTLLYCMNKMKKSFFSHPLTKSTVFYIDG